MKHIGTWVSGLSLIFACGYGRTLPMPDSTLPSEQPSSTARMRVELRCFETAQDRGSPILTCFPDDGSGPVLLLPDTGLSLGLTTD